MTRLVSIVSLYTVNLKIFEQERREQIRTFTNIDARYKELFEDPIHSQIPILTLNLKNLELK